MKQPSSQPEMKEMTLNISGFTKITLFNKQGYRLTQSLSPSGKFIVPANFRESRFIATKEINSDEKESTLTGTLAFG